MTLARALTLPSWHAAQCLQSTNARENLGTDGGCVFAFSELQCRRSWRNDSASWRNDTAAAPEADVPCSRGFSCHGHGCGHQQMPVLPNEDFLDSVSGHRFAFLGDSVTMQLECGSTASHIARVSTAPCTALCTALCTH